MPYQVIWEGEGFWVRYSGSPSDDELIAVVLACNQDDRFKTARYVLSDYLLCDSVSFSASLAAKLGTISHEFPNLNSQVKIAVIADVPDAIALASAYLPLQLIQHEIRVFQGLDEARNWCQR